MGIFGKESTFCLLPGLTIFEWIIDLDLLTEINVTIDIKHKLLKYNKNSKPTLFLKYVHDDFIQVEDTEVSKSNIKEVSDNRKYLQFLKSPLGTTEIRDLLIRDIISPSRSRYKNPMWVVNKKKGELMSRIKKRVVPQIKFKNHSGKIPHP